MSPRLCRMPCGPRKTGNCMPLKARGKARLDLSFLLTAFLHIPTEYLQMPKAFSVGYHISYHTSYL